MDRVRVVLAKVVLAQGDERGAVATEYGLTLLLISLAIIVAATAFGIALSAMFDSGTAGIPVG